MAHWRELWIPKLFDRQRLDRWEKGGAKTINERARERTIAIMEDYKPEPLPDAAEQEIETILKG
jgi:trimethylamine--corrinoid protein Co-methyltransferase